jgi:DNA-damage-inducible protein D
MARLVAAEYESFEAIKQVDENGNSNTELIANLFRISQIEEKLKIDQASTAAEANETHYRIAEKIRAAMIDMGTTLPENLPTPDKSIQVIEREEIRRLRESKTPLMPPMSKRSGRG